MDKGASCLVEKISGEGRRAERPVIARGRLVSRLSAFWATAQEHCERGYWLQSVE